MMYLSIYVPVCDRCIRAANGVCVTHVVLSWDDQYRHNGNYFIIDFSECKYTLGDANVQLAKGEEAVHLHAGRFAPDGVS